jgi:iron-sulfur cluster repair protein YtfE (RIC family)
MSRELHDFLSRDHARLDALLARCRDAAGAIPYDAYDAFRRGLLRHIGIEERVLFPELRKHHASPDVEHQLHRDHAALAALLDALESLFSAFDACGHDLTSRATNKNGKT